MGNNINAVSNWPLVSMVDGDLFDKLAIIGGLIRKKPNIPFGGIQVIVTGDFFQLPPVTKGTAVKFAFEAEWWGKTVTKTFNLTRVFRQKDQGLFPCTFML
jgi:ATP-dependent DNA helicase PIF1